MNRCKRKEGVSGLLLLALLAAADAALAAGCRSDTDCNPGILCLFAREHSTGICASWEPPIQIIPEIDLAQVPLRERGTGSRCQFSVDCAPGQFCYRRGHHSEGQCL